MKLKVYKAIALIAICLAGNIALAQSPVKPVDPVVQPIPAVEVNVAPVAVSATITSPVSVKAIAVQLTRLKTTLQNLSVQTNTQVVAAINNISAEADVDAIAPQVNAIVKNAKAHISTNADDVDLAKTYSKTYPADANDVLSIENKYGNVTVNTWNRNEFKVDVQIKVSAGSDDQAKDVLDNVKISDAKNGSTVAFRTIIEEVHNSWFSALTGNGAKRIEIDYTIYMPAKNEFVVDDRYGSIILPDLSGKVTINNAYGSLVAKSLSNESVIRVRYGSANIESLGNCTMQLSYGDLTVGSVNTLTADIGYSPAKIGKLHTAGTISLRYGGGLKIDDLDRNVKSLVINASYTNIDLGINSDENADFAIYTHYGDFDYADHTITLTDKAPDDAREYHASKNYKGYIGKAGSGKSITISSNYGNVKFN